MKAGLNKWLHFVHVRVNNLRISTLLQIVKLCDSLDSQKEQTSKVSVSIYLYNPVQITDLTCDIFFCLSHLGWKKAKAHRPKEWEEDTDLKKAQTECSEQRQQAALPQLLLQDSERRILLESDIVHFFAYVPFWQSIIPVLSHLNIVVSWSHHWEMNTKVHPIILKWTVLTVNTDSDTEYRVWYSVEK